MTAAIALVRKQLAEARWILLVSAAALFLMSWLTVFVTARIEQRMRSATDPIAAMRSRAFLRGMGGPAMDFSSAAIELTFWVHPFIILTVAAWPIGRGSAAVAGELERGTLDLVLSRPISRATYLASHVVVAALGLFVLIGAMIAGNLASNRYNTVATPATVSVLLPPALNLAALAATIYGVALLASACDLVRWRPTLVTSVFVLASYIDQVIANLPSMEPWKWIERYSIFHAYSPVEAALKGEMLGRNVAILGGIGLAGVVLALLVFKLRDLPTSG